MTLTMGRSHVLKRDGVYQGEYARDHGPIQELTEGRGPCRQRAMYFYIPRLRSPSVRTQEAIERIWGEQAKRMYVTSGIGPSESSMKVTNDYDLQT